MEEEKSKELNSKISWMDSPLIYSYSKNSATGSSFLIKNPLNKNLSFRKVIKNNKFWKFKYFLILIKNVITNMTFQIV